MGRSECDDLALLDVPLDGLPYLAWSDTPPVAGLPVVAVGFPDGDRRFFRARGQINREPGPGVTNWASIEEEIEHDATTAPGASGGPLVDGSTRVAGVHYAGLNNRSYAIAAHEAISVLERFAETSSPGSILTIGLNGEAFAATDTMPAGVFVRSVERGSPAALAGIEAGDLITTLNGVPLAEDGTMSAYCAVLRSTRPSSVLDVEIFRPDGAFLTGQVNGTPLVDSGTIPFDVTDPVESGAPLGPGDARVLASIPEDIRPTCQESPPEDWPNEAIASVKCLPESGVDVLWYDLFGTADDMDEYYFAVVTENGQTRSSGGPCNRRPGEVTFEVGDEPGGRLACYRRDGLGLVRVEDESAADRLDGGPNRREPAAHLRLLDHRGTALLSGAGGSDPLSERHPPVGAVPEGRVGVHRLAPGTEEVPPGLAHAAERRACARSVAGRSGSRGEARRELGRRLDA